MNITKTAYIRYRNCAKNAWLYLNKREIFDQTELSVFDQALMQTGNDVEFEARKLFPDGQMVEDRGEAGQKKTEEYLAAKIPTIFQAVFIKDGFELAVDILQYDSTTNTYTISEVKATNEIKDKIHLYDLAFQVIILQKCGLQISGINIMHLNRDYIRNGELDLTQMFVMEDAKQKVLDILPEVELDMQNAQAYLTNPQEPSGFCTCIYKGRSNHCDSFKYSNGDVPEYSIHDIARIGSSPKKLIEMIDTGVYTLDEIPEYIELSQIQRNQVDTHVTNRTIIDLDSIRSELESLTYPLYFLDYETYPSATPRFDGFAPYQQIPFQFSLHVVEDPNTTLTHHEFLHTVDTDPTPHFFNALNSVIGPTGSIIVWNKKFECKINEELAERYPEAKGFMEDINARTYDLMDIFHNQHYVHKDFRGSTSIKYVLPVLAPDLKYSDLQIKEGGTASQKWNELTTMLVDEAEKAKIAQDLLTYCKLDTYAMYAIWKHLYEL